MVTIRRLLFLVIISDLFYMRYSVFVGDKKRSWRSFIIALLIGLCAAIVLQLMGTSGLFTGK